MRHVDVKKMAKVCWQRKKPKCFTKIHNNRNYTVVSQTFNYIKYASNMQYM